MGILSRWFGAPETRQSYTSGVLELLTNQANGTTTAAAAGRTAVAEGCIGLWARTLGTATVAPAGRLALAGVTPDWLAGIGRALATYGESLSLIDVGPAGVRLLRCSTWDISGDADPASYRYRCDAAGPSTTRSQLVGPEAVVHLVIGAEDTRPWRGRGPLQIASETGRLVGAVETAVADEAQTAHGFAVPTPAGLATDKATGLAGDIRDARGRHFLSETLRGGRDPANAPAADWKPIRLGANPPQGLIELRRDTATCIKEAFGVPASILGDSEGSASREALRAFIAITLGPVAAVVEAELRRKLDPEAALGLGALAAGDVASRARAVGSLAKAGVELDDALRIAGIDDSE